MTNANSTMMAGTWTQWVRAGILAVLLGVFLLRPAPARAELTVDVTQGVTDPIPIAIVPFAHATAADGGFDIAAVVQRDLDSSGRFRTMKRTDMRTAPVRAAEVVVADWKAAGDDYVAVGRVSAGTNGMLIIDCDLVNVLTGEALASDRVTANAASLRNAAHQVSDFIYQRILGVRGAFATRIAYIAVDGSPPNQTYRLIVSDADGENAHTVLEQRQPIMSPSWSPDGKWLAYASFENHVQAIYAQNLATGQRRLVSGRIGVNSAPAWSPDGNHMALTLSGSSGNLDLYLLDLRTQVLTRLTDDPAIETEAAWSPDGKSIYFTSDRAGGPQIYRLDPQAPRRVQRITFGSSYNAHARVSPDGKQITFITRDGANYRIAVQDLASGTVTMLSHGSLDESPSFAPNGAVVIYSGRDGEYGTLATVSVDGQVTQRIKSDHGELREPVWGPFAS